MEPDSELEVQEDRSSGLCWFCLMGLLVGFLLISRGNGSGIVTW